MLKFNPNRNAASHCPCGKSNKDQKFAPYQGYENKGFCHSCGETFFPDTDKTPETKPVKQTPQKFVQPDIMHKTMKHYEINTFVNAFRFSKHVLDEFNIGTAKDGSVIFWLINERGEVCSAKKTAYLNTGKRDKSSYPVHLFKGKDGYKPCLFGLHRINMYHDGTTICLVESEKSAIIATQLFPEFLWLATGGSTGFTQSKAYPIRNRTVLLIIDCDEAGRKNATRTLQMLEKLSCSATLIDLDPLATDGTDIADIILSEDHNRLNVIHKLYEATNQNA